ncbi:hypothetical protein LCGC14_2110530 [marine sediment metagenome]|uniref:Calcineurin-like phosphoesterase domain-containing protein n=1 Tax=marine sediment metagenome TaxID=412755 RepID=A0A0F9GKF9_9ZZZZ
MKFILLSDLHLSWDNPLARMDDLVKVQFEKLKFVLDYAERMDVPILTAGDFFDRPRSWYLLPKIIQFLLKYQGNIYTIYGQHDTYLYSETTRDSTSLGILNEFALIHCLSEYPKTFVLNLGKKQVKIYGSNYGERLLFSNKDKQPNERYIKILIIHAPISTAPLFPGHEITHADKFLEKHPEFDLILCGDIHRDFIIERKGRFIVNCGPMLRREATEFNFTHKPHFLVYDTKDRTIEKVEIPHEPADKVLSREHIEQKEVTELMLEDFIESVKTGDIESVSFTDKLWAFIKHNNIEQEVVDILSKVMEKGK